MQKEFIRRGGLWVLTQNALLLAVLALGPLRRSMDWHRATFAAGVVLFLIGAVFGVCGVRALGRNLTPFPMPRDNAQLVQERIYRFVRHPLYSSLIFTSLGWALLWSSPAALVVALGLAVLLDAKARFEERCLREKFSEYESYARRVRRLVPWVY